VSAPVELPSPALAAAVDAHILDQLRRYGARTSAQLEVSLPRELVTDGSRMKTTGNALSRLLKSGAVRPEGKRFALAKVKP
jgi:hypothetical protein